jgi:hypothetical protein
MENVFAFLGNDEVASRKCVPSFNLLRRRQLGVLRDREIGSLTNMKTGLSGY